MEHKEKNMIIKRKYETIGILSERDPRIKDMFINDLKTRFDKNEAFRILEKNHDTLFYSIDMGSLIQDKETLLNKLDKLDKEEPYDNGLTYRDVQKVVPFPNRKGAALELWLIQVASEDHPTRIVEIIAIENEKGKTELIKPWDENYLP